MPVGSNILAGSSGQGTGYDIEQSLRFNDDDSACLQKAYASSGNRKTWTWSGWVKRSELGSATPNAIFSSDTGPQVGALEFPADDTFTFYDYTIGGSYQSRLVTTALYRDIATWYHIVVSYDTTQATSSNRIKIYINGSQVTDFSTETYPSEDLDGYINYGNNSRLHGLGKNTGLNDYLDGYLAEVHFIDGTALDASSFGETNSDTNQWVPVEYSGSYGTNGFYLKFQDSSALGDDSSGNTNDFTVTNLVATDQVLDSPTLNYCTMNPIDSNGSIASSEGNLKVTTTSTDPRMNATFQIPSTGKWYWEFLMQYSTSMMIGVIDQSRSGNAYEGNQSVLYSSGLGTKYNFSSVASYGATWTTGDLMGVAFNRDDNEITFYKNNSAQPTLTIGGTAAQRARLMPMIGTGTDGTGGGTFNFGQDSSFAGAKTAQGNGGDGEDFYYTPPTGYKALNNNNLDDPAIADPTKHFNSILYTGNGGTQALTGVGFAPDLFWNKNRTATYQHMLYDTVRGATKYLTSINYTDAEATDVNSLKSFDSDGVTLGSSASSNATGVTSVGWSWKAASSNTVVSAGSIDGTNPTIATTRRANTTSGFSIMSFTGNGSAGATIAHGLSQAPEMWITRSLSAAGFWYTGNVNYSSPAGNYYQHLSLDAAQASNTGVWNGTLPSSTVITLGNLSSYQNVSSRTYISYAFHSVEGYSKVGSYSGNGSTDGSFIYTGMAPAFIMVKRTDSADNWAMYDSARDTYNVRAKYLLADSDQAEATYSTAVVDFLSNGFKWRGAVNFGNNSSGSYIYLAIAESPFKTSNAR